MLRDLAIAGLRLRSAARWTGLPPAALWFIGGTFASNIGTGMNTLAAGALLYRETGTIAAFGIVVAMEQAVTFLMQTIAGPSVDRGDPRRTALVTEFMRGGLVCALSLMLAADSDHALAWILAMTVIIRIAHAFHRTATFAMAPALVPAHELARLNSWFSLSQQGGQLVGLSAAGFVIAQWGAPAAFFIDGVTYLISGASLAAIVGSATVAGTLPAALARPLWRRVIGDWAEFAALLRRDVRLLGLAVASTADNVVCILFNLVLPPVVADRFAADPHWLSLMAGGFAFGAMASSLAVVRTANAIGSRGTVALGIGGQALCFALLWGVDGGGPAVLLASAMGAFNTISWTMSLTTLQLAAPPSYRGRLATLRNGMTAAVTALLVPVMTWTAQSFANAALLLLSGAVCLVFLLIAAASGERNSPVSETSP